MNETPAQDDLFPLIEKDKPLREAPKSFKKDIKVLEMLDEDRKKEKEKKERQDNINEILKK